MPSIKITFLGTGAGNCVYRCHTAIVLDCPDGTRLLLDASSGNSVLRQGSSVGMMGTEFETVLLSHQHGDHMGGLPFIQGHRSIVNPQGPPLQVYSTEEALEAVRDLCGATRLTSISINKEGAKNREGHDVFRWHPIELGHQLQVGSTTSASSFPVDHISGAVGWRVDSAGASVIFSGDTRFSPDLVQAAQGAQILIHEALGTEKDEAEIRHRGHSTAADAGRAAALSGVAELVITHIDSPFHFDTQPLIDDARRYFDGPVSVATDLHQIIVDAP